MNTFAAYFCSDANVFFGNVGRHIDVPFPRRSEPFHMEEAFENLQAEKTLTQKKKIAKYERLEQTNVAVYKARRRKLVMTYNSLLQELENKNQEQIANIFERFLKEMQTLQENFKYQRDTIIRNHMIDMFGKFENADDQGFDFCFDNFLEFVSKS